MGLRWRIGVWLAASGLGLAIAIAGDGRANARSPVPADDSASPATAKETGDAQKTERPPRRKRGGPETGQRDKIDATPEGQSDLIKVLQPGSGQKSK